MPKKVTISDELEKPPVEDEEEEVVDTKPIRNVVIDEPVEKTQTRATIPQQSKAGRIVSVTYSKTVQEKDYEPQNVGFTYALAEGEDPEDAFNEMREMALYLLHKDED